MSSETLDLSIFNHKFQTAQEHLEEMLLQVGEEFVPSELLAKALQELSTSLEELHVISEEMYEQREQLSVVNQTIQRERQHYQELFDLASDGYLATDVKGVIQEVNHTATVLLNLRRKWLIGKPMAALILQADDQNFYTLLSRLQQGEQIKSVELRLQTREKSLLYGAFKVIALRNHQNQIIGYRWLFQDITKLKLSENSLRLIQFALDRVQDSVFLVEPDGSFSYVNEAACGNLGYSHEELLNMTVFDIDVTLHSEHWSTIWNQLKREYYLNPESIFHTKTGEEFQ